jgi:pantoate--beta-alanine ligase
MSSRNMRLNENERRQATAIYRAMQIIRQGLLAKQPSPEILQKAALQELQQNGFEPIDYIAITHPATLEPFNSDDLNAGLSAIILVAAFLGKVRLIDNLKVG